MNRLADTSVICLGYHPWSPMWKRNQSMMAEFARQGLCRRLVFLNPEIELTSSPQQVWRQLGTVKRYSYAHVVPRRPEPRTTVMTPVHWMPFRARSEVVRRLDQRLMRRAVRAARGDGTQYVLLINTVRPESQELVELLWDDACLRVFDWSDDFARFPLEPRGREEIARITDHLIERVDHVIAVNQNLAARVHAHHRRVTTVINATNMTPRFQETLSPPDIAALDRSLAHPVLGYAGFINEHRIDLELVVELAQRHPDWTLFFIGPVQLDFDRRFPELPNIRFHPPVPYARLQDYLALFDVSLIPHLDNAHTAGNNPLKLYDYLSTGRPIVATRIAGLEGFEDVVEVAETRAAFHAAVEAAVGAGRLPGRQARLERAQEHHWSVRAREAAAVIDAALARPASPAAG